MSYINSVLSRNCYEELSTLFTKTNNPSKEISESYGAFHHITRAMDKDNMRMEYFLNLHIGDGSTARTGALFTFMSKSINISIDPLTNLVFMEDWIKRYNVRNFDAIKDTWQNHIIETSKKINLVLVHSHVNTFDIMVAYPNWYYTYVNPCCMKDKQILTIKQLEKNDISVVIAGEDLKITSPQRQVFVYRNNKMFKSMPDVIGFRGSIEKPTHVFIK